MKAANETEGARHVRQTHLTGTRRWARPVQQVHCVHTSALHLAGSPTGDSYSFRTTQTPCMARIAILGRNDVTRKQGAERGLTRGSDLTLERDSRDRAGCYDWQEEVLEQSNTWVEEVLDWCSKYAPLGARECLRSPEIGP